ncbi:MAG: protein adenylyltransferase SelO family protein [Synechococcus sp.]|nr:protein adenylyltransferase SelO family protein [Synechococcus sp.]
MNALASGPVPDRPDPGRPVQTSVQTSVQTTSAPITTFEAFAQRADYSLLDCLWPDPQASGDGNDHRSRQVLRGHYVPVKSTPLPAPEYVAHSPTLFDELGLSDALVHDERFRRLFSGDGSAAQQPMRPLGWATGYALSIYGAEYTQQCPFGNGNGYGDGRAISVFEGVFRGRRWEMQLKGGGPTPYCRGADGRAVLRSSVREFLAQEFMHALGVPTSRSLTLYMSRSETVRRPWYSPNSSSFEPDILQDNPAAITTRVAPSFLRVGQLELFARRVRRQAHPAALEELRMIVAHLIERNYRPEIDANLEFSAQLLALAELFRGRLISLVANWMRVGYCQGNFNSDNCAAGGYTLDYGPFGFCELFDPRFQPWTGGGEHFCFFNQPLAAEANYQMFWAALRPLLDGNTDALARLDQIREGFAAAMERELEAMWAGKLGLSRYDDELVNELLQLMLLAQADYTILFSKLSEFPDHASHLKPSFYQPSSAELEARWNHWLMRWRGQISSSGDPHATTTAMQRLNPRITWREWLIAPAYEQAAQADTSLLQELQTLFRHPYDEPSPQLAASYDRRKPSQFFNAGGVSHYSCSS